jgi:hypothetical protein
MMRQFCGLNEPIVPANIPPCKVSQVVVWPRPFQQLAHKGDGIVHRNPVSNFLPFTPTELAARHMRDKVIYLITGDVVRKKLALLRQLLDRRVTIWITFGSSRILWIRTGR